MLNLAFAQIPSPGSPANQKPLGPLAAWLDQRARYRQAMRELHRLDNRDLDELAIGRADFPALAERHAAHLAPLTPTQLASRHVV